MSSELIIAAPPSILDSVSVVVNDCPQLFQACFYFQDLIKDLHSELSGDFRKLVMAMLKAPAEFDASELYSSIKVKAQITTIKHRSVK